jgi:hypothetical protein
MTKTDLSKTDKSYYSARQQPEVIELSPCLYLSLEGRGDPSSKAFAQTVQALYSVAYTLKFLSKMQGKDFVVSKLEGEWWFDEQKFANISMADAPTKIPRSEWHYRLLIRLPDFVSMHDAAHAITAAFEKKQLELVLTVEPLQTGRQKVAQILHIGPFDREPESLLRLKTFMDTHRLERNGHHREVYLSDFRKTAPEKLKTILREPTR